MSARRAVVACLAGCLLTLCCLSPAPAAPALDRAWWQAVDQAQPPRPYHGIVRTSQYVTMRDGVRLAVDVYLPADRQPGDTFPAIISQTRYWRRMDINPPFDLIFKLPDEIRRIVENGYALVRLDARGTGASFGSRRFPWSPDEVADGAQVVDWIVAQPWCGGRVGAVGGSYEGTAAEFLVTTGHPAVKAAAPMFSVFDVYADIAFPGGIHLAWFSRTWQRGNGIMDANQPQAHLWFARLFTRGVARVDGDRGGRLLAQAVREHRANYRVHDEARQLVFRDDVSPGGFRPDDFSPHTRTAQLRRAGLPLYSYSGWRDGGYAHAAIKRHLTVETPGSRLLLGPWDHGGDDHCRPFHKPIKARFDHLGELQRFFDLYLKDKPTGLANEQPVHYYTMVADRWNAADTWPPPAKPLSLFLAPDHALATASPAATGADDYRVDPRVGTGDLSRWNSLADDVAVRYPDRKARDRKLLVYDSDPLPAATEVTGHPVVELFVSADRTDAQVFVYLEDVAPDGRVAYVTEGMLRAIHRHLSDKTPPYVSPTPFRTFDRADAAPLTPHESAKLVFDLHPISYEFAAGHRVRLAIAGADRDHFRPLSTPPTTLRLHRGTSAPSHLTLPVVRR